MAITRTVTPAQLKAHLASLDKHLRTATRNAVLEAAAAGAEVVARAAPVDTGRLKQSITVRKKGPSGHPEIVAQAPHAGPVEVGSRPHWVPIKPLERWVRRHAGGFGIMARAKGRTRGIGRLNRGLRRGARAKSDAAITRIAHAIQLKIARYGTAPRWYMRKSLPRLRMILNTLLRESKARALAGIRKGGA